MIVLCKQIDSKFILLNLANLQSGEIPIHPTTKIDRWQENDSLDFF